jgi:hypothetical protein
MPPSGPRITTGDEEVDPDDLQSDDSSSTAGESTSRTSTGDGAGGGLSKDRLNESRYGDVDPGDATDESVDTGSSTGAAGAGGSTEPDFDPAPGAYDDAEDVGSTESERSSGGDNPGQAREQDEEDTQDTDSQSGGGSSPGGERDTETPDTVGNDGPGGVAPTEEELYGGDSPPDDLGRDPDPDDDGGDVVFNDGPGGGSVTGDDLTGGNEPNTGLEDGAPQEKYHLGDEHGDEEGDLSGLENRQDLDENVSEAVSNLEEQLRNQGIDPGDYAIRRDGDGLTVDYDTTGVAKTISERVLDENPNADRGDFAVERTDDGGFQVEWGEHAGQAEAVDRVVQRVKEEYPGIGTEDFAVYKSGDGQLEVSIGDQYRRDYTRQQVQETLEERFPAADDYEISVGDDGQVEGRPVFDESETQAANERGALGGPQQATERIEEQVLNQNENLKQGDIRVTERSTEDISNSQFVQDIESSPYQIEYTDQYKRRQAEQYVQNQEEQNPGLDLEVTRNDEGDIAIRTVETPEQFGDGSLDVPFDGSDKSFEEYLEDASDSYSEFAEGIGEAAGTPVAVAEGAISSDLKQLDGKSVGDVIGETATDLADGTSAEWFVDGVVEDYMAPRVDEDEGAIQSQVGEGGTERAVEKFVSGSAQLANLPGWMLSFREAGEYAGWAAKETVGGRGGVNVDVSAIDGDAPDIKDGEVQVGATEFDVNLTEDGVVGKTGRAVGSAGTGAVQYFKQNPAKATGTTAGALVGSYAIMSKAPRSAWIIQPGEEIATRGATAVLSRSATGRRILSKFPGKKIDNEEIVIRGAQRAYGRGRSVARSATRAAKRKGFEIRQQAPPAIRRFLRDESAQGDFIPDGGQRFRVEGESSESVTIEGEDIESTDFNEDAEIAKQQYEQTMYEQKQEYGEVERDSVPEFRDEKRGDYEVGQDIEAQQDPSLELEMEDLTPFQRRQLRGRMGATGKGSLSTSQVEQPSISSEIEMENVRPAVESEVAAKLEEDLANSGFGRLEAFMESDAQSVDSEFQTEEMNQQEAQLSETDTEVDTGQEFGAYEFEGEVNLEQNLEQELSTEASLDTELETELETESEYEQAYETEFESEFENEFEFETETEFEAETDLPDEPDQATEDDFGMGLDTDEETWDTGFADAEELLDDMFEDDFSNGGFF